MSQLLLETQIDIDDDTQTLFGSQPDTDNAPDNGNSQLQVADSQLLPDTQVADSQLLPDTQVADSQLPVIEVADSQLIPDTQAADSQLLPNSHESTSAEVEVGKSSQVKKRPRHDDIFSIDPVMKFQGVMNMVFSMLQN